MNACICCDIPAETSLGEAAAMGLASAACLGTKNVLLELCDRHREQVVHFASIWQEVLEEAKQ